GFSRAIITAGGVSLHDIDMRTMRSKKVENLFFTGEMIDIDGPTGGYNLQVCWSTGYLAGVNAAPCQTGSTKT
ncbi:MAG: NAD(P)/FAD-dependent oxidoreductase, partial [Deltaproteobacteria bacterium]|nr:NAD(P)/FAD-dependent oxidoreductase [Deltaproteobacteria bacterium]